MFRHQKKHKTAVRIVKTVCLAGLCLSMSISTSATGISDAQSEKSDLQDQLEDVQDTIDKLKKEADSTEEYMKELDQKLTDLSAQLASLEKQLDDSQKQLEENEKQLEEAKATEEQQYNDMKKRIKFLYENGSEAYLEMILEAKNFAELLNKADYVEEMSQYDRNMLTEYQNTRQMIADKQTEIEEENAKIEKLKEEAQSQKKSVQAMSDQKEVEYQAYQKKIQNSESVAAEYEAQIQEQEDLIARLEAEAEKKRKAEEEKAAAEAAAKAKEEAEKSKTNSTESTTKTETTQASNDKQESVYATGYIWPCPSSRNITSNYGYRIHPITGAYKLHNGIDISAPTGTVIVAAAGGTVASAAYSSSMGNYIMIDHGNSIFTIYMHCSALAVSSGQTVRQGQTIGYVGSTGNSTGPHLHFSVRSGGSYVNPLNYVSK